MQITTDTSEIWENTRIGFVLFLVFLALESVISFTKTRFYWKWSHRTLPNYVETFRANIGHSLTQKFLTRHLPYRKLKLWPHSSKRDNWKRRFVQPHVLIFFLICSTFFLNCTIAYLVAWMSQKSYNINIWQNVNTTRKIRKGLLPINRKGLLQNNNTSHSSQNTF